MKEFLKKMLWGGLCLLSSMLFVTAVLTSVGAVALAIKGTHTVACLCGLVSLFGVDVETYKIARFSGRKFNEIDIQFVDRMKKLGKWIKTGVEKVLNLVPGLSRTKSVQNEQNMDNSIVKNQDKKNIEVGSVTNEVMTPETNQDYN